jgi:hypothetical protein
MLAKIKTLIPTNSTRFVMSRFYTPDTDSKSLQIVSCRQRLRKVIESLNLYDTQNISCRHTNEKCSVKCLAVDKKCHGGILSDEHILTNSYENLLNEQKEILIELRSLNAVDEYLHITKDYIKHIYD